MKKLLILLIIGIFVGCKTTYTGCGIVKSKSAPKAQNTIIYDCCGNSYKITSGKYYYPVTVKGIDNKSHKVYVNYPTWFYAQKGDTICVK